PGRRERGGAASPSGGERRGGWSIPSTARDADADLGPRPGHLDLELPVLVLEAGHALEGDAVLGGELAGEGVEGVARAHRGKQRLAPSARRVREVAERVVVVGAAGLGLAA